MKLVAIALVLLLPTIGVHAESGVPASIQSVVSGGYWKAKDSSGTYRVVVVNQGYEHVTSRVFVEWLRGPSSPNEEANIVSSVEPQLPFGKGVASLSASLKPLATGRIQVVLSGVVSAEPSRKVTAILVASQPGLLIMAANPSFQRTASGVR